ncbi:hypothetical protein LCGC14_3145580, partial [marine sediment metagenome]
GTGICHQVNLEYIGKGVWSTEDADGHAVAYPDTCVGTDSHTTMINGLGVLGWGVGGIEAEAAMLGRPASMLIPQVIGFQLRGELREGATATDLVLRITEMLREKGVVGKFVAFLTFGTVDENFIVRVMRAIACLVNVSYKGAFWLFTSLVSGCLPLNELDDFIEDWWLSTGCGKPTNCDSPGESNKNGKDLPIGVFPCWGEFIRAVSDDEIDNFFRLIIQFLFDFIQDVIDSVQAFKDCQFQAPGPRKFPPCDGAPIFLDPLNGFNEAVCYFDCVADESPFLFFLGTILRDALKAIGSALTFVLGVANTIAAIGLSAISTFVGVISCLVRCFEGSEN